MIGIRKEQKIGMLSECRSTPLEAPEKTRELKVQNLGKGKNNMKITQFSSCKFSGWIVRDMIDTQGIDDKVLDNEGDGHDGDEGKGSGWEDQKTKRTDKGISNKKPDGFNSVRGL